MLKILGIVFLVVCTIVLLAIGLFVVWIRYKITKVKNVIAIENALSETPEMQLSPSVSAQWRDPSTYTHWQKQFENHGFEKIDRYLVEHHDDIRLEAWYCDDPSCYILLAEHAQLGFLIDLCFWVNDNETLSLSSIPEFARGAPRPAHHKVVYVDEDTDVSQLLGHARSATLATPAMQVAPEDFLTKINSMLLEMHEFNATANVDQEWLEGLADSVNVQLTGDEAEWINECRASQRHEELYDTCLKSYAESSALPAAQWEQIRHELVFVYDDLPADILIGEIYTHVEVPEELEAEFESLEEKSAPGRMIMQMANDVLPAHLQLVKVGSISTPVEADVYRPALAQSA